MARLSWSTVGRLLLCHVLVHSSTTTTSTVLAQQQNTYYFSGAIQIVGSGTSNTGGTAAVPAQCPADHPVSCDSISEADLYVQDIPYIPPFPPADVLPSVAAPPTTTAPGPTASSPAVRKARPAPPVAPASSPSPAKAAISPPAGTKPPPPGTPRPPSPPSTPIRPITSRPPITPTAVGPGLPATGAGDCGTILIVPAAAAKSIPVLVDWRTLLLLLCGLHAAGGGVLFLRH
nr:hypothetical protein CFP56_37248 [Quercus suber]